MTIDEFVNKYLGKKIDFDGYYGGQCVDLYRQYVAEVLEFPQSPGVGGAAEIWDSADPEYYDFINNDPLAIPNRGDIVIWNRKSGGGFGHVAVFLEGDVTRFKSFDQNWPTLDVCTITEHNYTNVIGWMRPKGDKIPSNNNEIMSKLLEHMGVKTEDEAIHVWDQETGFLKSEREKTARLTAEKEQLEKIFVERREALAKNLGTVNSWDEIILASSRFRGLDDKNRELEDKLERERKEHAQEIAECESRLNALKTEIQDLKQKHEAQIENIEKRVTDEIEALRKQKEQYETVTKFIDWVKSLFRKDK